VVKRLVVYLFGNRARFTVFLLANIIVLSVLVGWAGWHSRHHGGPANGIIAGGVMLAVGVGATIQYRRRTR
jgi:hypothetical protein